MKSLFLLAATAISSTAIAAGPYDGIWALSLSGLPMGYYSIHENTNGTMVVIGIPDDNGSWDAHSGERDQNTITIQTIYAGVEASSTITFNSDTDFTAVVNSCKVKVYGWRCPPEKSILAGKKVF